MTDPKLRDEFLGDDELRPSHDMLETAREIRVSPEEQEEVVAQEERRRLEQAARLQHEKDVARYEKAVARQQRTRRALLVHAVIFVMGGVALVATNLGMGGTIWFQWPLLTWALALTIHAGWVFSRPKPEEPAPLQRVTDPLTASLRSLASHPLPVHVPDEYEEDESTQVSIRRRP